MRNNLSFWDGDGIGVTRPKHASLPSLKAPPLAQSLTKSFGILTFLLKLAFLLGRLGGKSPHIFSVEEKRFSISKLMPLLWEVGRRAGAYYDPLSFNLGVVD